MSEIFFLSPFLENELKSAMWFAQSLENFRIKPCFKLPHNFTADLSAVFLGFHEAVYSLMFSIKAWRPSQDNNV